MPIARIKPFAKDGVYFVTPTVWNWYYLFDRHNRWQILAESLQYCQRHKSLKIYAYVFMLNHLHLILQANDAETVLRVGEGRKRGPHPGLSSRLRTLAADLNHYVRVHLIGQSNDTGNHRK